MVIKNVNDIKYIKKILANNKVTGLMEDKVQQQITKTLSITKPKIFNTIKLLKSSNSLLSICFFLKKENANVSIYNNIKTNKSNFIFHHHYYKYSIKK